VCVQKHTPSPSSLPPPSPSRHEHELFNRKSLQLCMMLISGTVFFKVFFCRQTYIFTPFPAECFQLGCLTVFPDGFPGTMCDNLNDFGPGVIYYLTHLVKYIEIFLYKWCKYSVRKYEGRFVTMTSCL
jgi:hypothetical protein